MVCVSALLTSLLSERSLRWHTSTLAAVDNQLARIRVFGIVQATNVSSVRLRFHPRYISIVPLFCQSLAATSFEKVTLNSLTSFFDQENDWAHAC